MIIIKSKLNPEPDFKAEVIASKEEIDRFFNAILNDNLYMQHLVDKYDNYTRKEKTA